MQQTFHPGDERSPCFRSPDADEYAGFSITGKLPAVPPRDDGGLLAARGMRRSLSDGRDSAHFLVCRRRTRSVGTRARHDHHDHDDDEHAKDGGGGEVVTSDEPPDHQRGFRLGPDRHVEPDWNAELLGRRCSWGTGGAWPSSAPAGPTAVGAGLQRRLARVRTELARADTRLLCERAHSQHLCRERQEVAEKERSLSRQVDVAVMVIAALKEQINASENELERRERQVLSIQKFLETAARQETSGKVRIQLFIENLLRRIALAETLLEDFQRRQTPATNRDKPRRVAKSRSAGCQLACGLHGNAGPSPSAEQRERLARSSRLFCRPEHRDDIWNQRRRSAGYEA
ncbi:uncharacterized protein znf365 isoform X2 [Festucalex cinctus]